MSGAAREGFSGWRLAKESVVFLSTHPSQAMRIAGPWLVVVMLANYGSGYVISWLFGRASFESLQIIVILNAVVRLIAWGLAYGVVAVAWHRLVLRGDTGFAALLPSRAALLYVLLIAATYFVVWLTPYAGAFYVMSSNPGFRLGIDKGAGVILSLAFAVALVLLGVAMRFSLKFPAIALGDREMTLRRSWSETAALWPGLLWGTIVITVPTIVALRVVGYLARYASNYPAVVGFAVVNTAIIFASVLVYATFLSLAYRRTGDDVSDTFA